MYGTPAAQSYQDHQELSTAPLERLLACYDAFVERTEAAMAAIEAERMQEKMLHLGKAAEIVALLVSALDFDAAPDLAQRLAALYAFVDRCLADAMLYNDTGALAAAHRVMRTLRAGWRQLQEVE